MILGIDEVGRGAWAGPLVVGACVLNNAHIEGLTDSKKLTKKMREQLNAQILESPAVVGLGWVWADEIDKIGLSASLKLATSRAVKEVQVQCKETGVCFDEIIIDGTINFLKYTRLSAYVTTLKKADLLIPSVSAAAICAKVARDHYMYELDEDDELRDFKFGSHVGYGTAAHRQALVGHAPSLHHRRSFKPIAVILDKDIAIKQSTKSIGDKAEDEVANFLERKKHIIVARNWRTRWCEVDIITKYNKTYYFTEVKYRKNDDFGGGEAAISNKKLNQMKFAAEYFAHKNINDGSNLQLCAAIVEGEDFTIKDWFEL